MYPAATHTTWGAVMTGLPGQLGPPPKEGSRGPVGVKGQGPERREEVERQAGHGAIVRPIIIRPPELLQLKGQVG